MCTTWPTTTSVLCVQHGPLLLVYLLCVQRGPLLLVYHVYNLAHYY